MEAIFSKEGTVAVDRKKLIMDIINMENWEKAGFIPASREEIQWTSGQLGLGNEVHEILNCWRFEGQLLFFDSEE